MINHHMQIKNIESEFCELKIDMLRNSFGAPELCARGAGCRCPQRSLCYPDNPKLL